MPLWCLVSAQCLKACGNCHEPSNSRPSASAKEVLWRRRGAIEKWCNCPCNCGTKRRS
ncbi:unnamed protein product [Larinioides sclopetarius]|uniref:Uncharacterized protein n=1 Tax=Larinioides sclopetarius TaxID=280406 RepID=A0AAV2BRR4_9ARAC